MKSIKYTITAFLLCLSMVSFAQNKDIDKGKEVLAKAFTITDQVKKNETIQKAIELFTKGGMKKEMNYLVGDAFLENKDLVQAGSYYGRCDKGEKADGYKKLAAAYVDAAFNEPKAEAKNLKNAVNYYNKSGSIKEGGTVIGDRFYESGEANYGKALDYYFMASDTLSVEKVAKNYADQGGEKAKEAVEIYKRIGSKNALINGGDLAFNQKQFPTAYLMYSKAQYAPGLKKCAEKMFDLGQEEEANNIYVEMVTAYMKTAQTEEVEKLGKQNVAKMNYNLASRIYDKAGNLALSKKYAAYNKIMQLDLDSAKIMLEAIGETDLLKAIESNDKYLSMLKLSKNDFEDWRRQRPTVGTETDAEGRTIPKATDEVMLVDFYKNIKDAIVDDCITISKNVPPISNATLKSMMKASFLEYPAVGKILDPNTFSVKIPKANVQIKDVYLK